MAQREIWMESPLHGERTRTQELAALEKLALSLLVDGVQIEKVTKEYQIGTQVRLRVLISADTMQPITDSYNAMREPFGLLFEGGRMH
ncbi:hypothetical protein AAVH_26838 [Aphelenchoides avenae]|nr:hypothetical protein AAVH_26838 [Aphelenchus avenae]